MMQTYRRHVLTALVAAAFAPATLAQGASYPSKPITFVVPFAAGSATDQLARALGQEVSKDAKQPVVVDNKPGAVRLHRRRGRQEGGARRLHGVHHDQHDARRQRASVQEAAVRPGRRTTCPVTGLGKGGQIMIVEPERAREDRRRVHRSSRRRSPARSASAAAARRRASPARCSSRWPASSCCTCPYKSNPLAINDLLGGQINMMITDMATGLPQVKGGKVRALGVTSPKRSPLAPEVPTINEAGLKGYEMRFWFAAYVPANTPQPVIDRLHALLTAAAKSPATQNFYSTTGTDLFLSTPSELAKFQAAESQRWGQVVKAAGIEPE